MFFIRLVEVGVTYILHMHLERGVEPVQLCLRSPLCWGFLQSSGADYLFWLESSLIHLTWYSLNSSGCHKTQKGKKLQDPDITSPPGGRETKELGPHHHACSIQSHSSTLLSTHGDSS